jgi:hypothetical protein
MFIGQCSGLLAALCGPGPLSQADVPPSLLCSLQLAYFQCLFTPRLEAKRPATNPLQIPARTWLRWKGAQGKAGQGQARDNPPPTGGQSAARCSRPCRLLLPALPTGRGTPHRPPAVVAGWWGGGAIRSSYLCRYPVTPPPPPRLPINRPTGQNDYTG